VFLYFFFRNGDSGGVAAMVASLIEQLFRTKMHQKVLFNVIEEYYDQYGSSPCDSPDRLWEMLGKMLMGFPTQVNVLLDALDECSDRESIFNHMDGIKARFVFTSRPERDICAVVEKSSNFHSVEMDVRKDIEQFVTSKVRNNSALADFEDLIVKKIMKTSDGMFRYAELMIEELNIPSNLTVAEVLNNLPPGLDEMYTLVLQRLPTRLKELTKTTLMYIACAHRPVTVDEVIFAHAVKLGERDFDPKKKRLATKDQVLQSCGSLIEIFMYSFDDFSYEQRRQHRLDPTETLRFSHLTIKDFLLGDPAAIQNLGVSGNTNYDRKTSLQVSMARMTSTCCLSNLSVPRYSKLLIILRIRSGSDIYQSPWFRTEPKPFTFALRNHICVGACRGSCTTRSSFRRCFVGRQMDVHLPGLI
jgi:hypothetical protein